MSLYWVCHSERLPNSTRSKAPPQIWPALGPLLPLLRALPSMFFASYFHAFVRIHDFVITFFLCINDYLCIEFRFDLHVYAPSLCEFTCPCNFCSVASHRAWFYLSFGSSITRNLQWVAKAYKQRISTCWTNCHSCSICTHQVSKHLVPPKPYKLPKPFKLSTPSKPPPHC